MVELGCKDWKELALLLFAEICSRCKTQMGKSHDYRVCEICPKALTIHRLSQEENPIA